MIKSLPLQSNLMVALSQVQKIVSVLELPVHYDGYIAFELPPQGEQSTMHGMEQRFDGHCWTEYVTCSSDLFKGVVRFSRCAGHLQCVNIDCNFYLRTRLVNETQWKGRLARTPSQGMLITDQGKLHCVHCREQPQCVKTCPAVIYYCIP